jgi:D-inositol-3-phosphate glycosyltransferase
MRIGVISYHSSPLMPAGAGTSGGMNIFIARLYRELARWFPVDIFTYGRKGRVRIGNHLQVIHHEHTLEDFADDVIREHEKNPYSIVHTHYWLSGFIGMLVSKRIKVPWLHSYHTIESFKHITHDKTRIEIETAILKKCKYVISPTRREAFDLKQIEPRTPVLTIPHGVETETFRPSANGHNSLLFVGRVDPIKGLEVLIDALKLVGRDVRLNVIGGASKDRSSYESITSYGRNLRINFKGRVAHDRLVHHYRTAGIVVIPSYYESFGLVGLEAMASARPVIGFDDTGLVETVGSDAGILVSRNEHNLAHAISYLIHNKERRYELGLRGRDKAVRYSWRAIAGIYRKIYEAITKT